MIAHKKEFFGGVALMVAFLVVLLIFFLPIYGGGKNGLDYLDSLYNSISKGSAYYIPKVKKDNEPFKAKNIELILTMVSPNQAQESVGLLAKSGATATAMGDKLTIGGSLGKILANCLDDSDDMFHNNGAKVKDKYGYDEKKVLYNWYTMLKSMDKEMKKTGLYPEAKFVTTVSKRAVECSFNYYKIEPQSISSKMGMVIFSLLFYVIYTLWYGYAIMFMFEGWGLKLGH
ncbi:MAG: hypothetical protein HQK57_00535 [Deltaproteobacteria bacterium]|nr:hypothetical protein [Deltaproteobacteria bacterium]MBF0523778.1 hypothetical protein [Deltaproteobacteria bacterium]